MSFHFVWVLPCTVIFLVVLNVVMVRKDFFFKRKQSKIEKITLLSLLHFSVTRKPSSLL